MTGKFGVGWRQVGACLFLLAACSMIAGAYSVIAVPLGKEFQPSRMVLMLAMTVLSLVGGVLSPFLGSLMDRTSVRNLMALGALLLVAGLVALSFATSFTQVLIIYGVFMAPANVLIGPLIATVLLSRWFANRRGTALGIAISGVAMGTFFYPPLIQWLLDNNDWRHAFRWLALIMAVFTLPAVALVVNRPADRGLFPDGADHDPEGAVAGMPAAAPLSARDILADPTFWLVAGVFAVILSGMKGTVTNLVPLAIDEGIKPSMAALLLSIYAACGFVAKLSFAVVADRLNPRTLMLGSLVGFAAGMACMIMADVGYWVIAVGVGVVGMFGGVMVPLQSFLVPRIFGRNVVGRAAGLLSFATLCAMLATPPIFGLIYDLTGNYDAVFLGFTVLAAATLIAVPYIRLYPRATAAERMAAAGQPEVAVG